MTLREIFIMIKGIKSELAEELDAIDADEIHSGEYKLGLKREAKERARERLAEIRDLTDEAVADYISRTKGREVFDYSDPRLLSAVTFVQAAGAAMPEAAWLKMVEDFRGRPKTLKYLADLFESHRAIDAAIAASEAAKDAEISESFPDRVADFIYYETGRDPDASFDPSGFEYELAQYDPQPSASEEDE